MSSISNTAECLGHHPVLALAILTFTSIIFRGIYNRYFHPLRYFPGPFWASVSDFWKLIPVFKQEGHRRGLQLHKKYGPVIRIAPNLLAFNDPTLLPQMYHRRVDKTDTYSAGILGENTPPFQTQKHEEHAMKRKRVAFSYSMTNLRKFEGDIDNTILELMDTLRNRFAKTGDRLDWADWARWFVYDAVSQLAFGKSIGFIREGRDIEKLIAAFHSMATLAGLVAVLPWVMNPLLQNPFSKRFLMPKSGDSTGTGQIMAFRDRMLKERFRNPQIGQHGDFLDNLLQAKNTDDSPMSMEDIETEVFVLMVAAPDTTAALICPLVNSIVQDPRVYSKLMQEIDLFETTGKLSFPVATFDETNQMPYFLACVKEALRFSPSTPFLIPRYISVGGMEINGRFAPAHTEIGANPYIIHRNTEIFGHDADIYRPERWMADEETTKTMDKYLLSWGYGTRVCLGKNIAQLQVQKMVLQLFREFHVKSATPEKPFIEKNMGIMMYYEQWLTVKERLSSNELTQKE